MKKILLIGGLIAMLVTPALAEEPLNPNDPYKTDEEHLSAQSREIEQGMRIETSPQAGTTNWQWGGSTYGMSNRDDSPYIRGHRDHERRGR